MNVIVTGASRGVGFELVKAFASKPSNHIIAISRNEEKLEELTLNCRKEFPDCKIDIFPFDLSDFENYDNLKAGISKIFNSIDILINNAGILINKTVKDLSIDDFDMLFNVNVKSAFFLIQTLKASLKKDSHIVNISSMGGYQGSSKFPGLSLYSSSKGALSVLTECLAEEFKEEGIKVNCLALGAVQTEMLEDAFPGYIAPLSAKDMAVYVKEFAVKGHHYYNGKILPVSLTTP
jgi:NAD(P)-dependent dehydrogenase (short-subunit alcohol dehydrogenase family)